MPCLLFITLYQTWAHGIIIYYCIYHLNQYNILTKKKKNKQQNRQTKNKLMVQAPTSAVLEALIPIFFSGGPL